MITGFRLDTGGAQAKYDVRPDLTTFGKVIGGGLPIGAVGGRREVMETLTPLGTGVPRRHAGRQPAGDRGRPGRARPARPRRLHRAGGPGPPPRRRCCATRAPRPASRPSSRWSARSSAWSAATAPRPIDFDGAKRTDEAAYAAFFQAMLAEGVAMAPGAYEAIFVGLGHDDAVLADLGERAARAAVAAARRSADAHAVAPDGVPPAAARAASSVAVMRQVISWRFVATIGALLGLTAVVYLAFGNNRSVAEVIEDEGPIGPPRRPRLDRARHDARRLRARTTRRHDGHDDDAGAAGGLHRRGARHRLPRHARRDHVRRPRPAVRPARPDARRHRSCGSPSCRWARTSGSTCRPSRSSTAATPTSSTAGRCPTRTVIDRRCDGQPGESAESFSEFLRLQGEAFHSLYDLGRGAITAVIC